MAMLMLEVRAMAEVMVRDTAMVVVVVVSHQG